MFATVLHNSDYIEFDAKPLIFSFPNEPEKQNLPNIFFHHLHQLDFVKCKINSKSICL